MKSAIFQDLCHVKNTLANYYLGNRTYTYYRSVIDWKFRRGKNRAVSIFSTTESISRRVQKRGKNVKKYCVLPFRSIPCTWYTLHVCSEKILSLPCMSFPFVFVSFFTVEMYVYMYVDSVTEVFLGLLAVVTPVYSVCMSSVVVGGIQGYEAHIYMYVCG